MEWNKQQIADLTRMWCVEGKTSGTIAMVFGVSRSAIMGKVGRLKLVQSSVKEKPEPKFKLKSIARSELKIPKMKPPGPLPVDFNVAKVGVGLLALKPGHCREIIGRDDTVHKLAIFCGEPQIGSASYCLKHYNKNHNTQYQGVRYAYSGGVNPASQGNPIQADAPKEPGD